MNIPVANALILYDNQIKYYRLEIVPWLQYCYVLWVTWIFITNDQDREKPIYPQCRIYASMNCVSIGPDNGLSPVRRQAIIWTFAGLLTIGLLGTIFSEILSKIQNVSFKKMHLKISSVKWWPFRPGGFELICQQHYVGTLRACTGRYTSLSLQWRHNERDSVSNHRRLECLLNRLFRRRSKKISKLRVTGLCEGNSPVSSEFTAQRTSNAELVSIWWRHHDDCCRCPGPWHQIRGRTHRTASVGIIYI